jgi:serine protease Do
MKKFCILTVLFATAGLYAQKVKIISSQPKTNIAIIQKSFYDKTSFIDLGNDSVVYENDSKEILIRYNSANNLFSATHLITKKEIKKLKNRIKLSPIVSLPSKALNRRFIEIDNVALNVKKQHYDTKFYDNQKDFLENNSSHISASKEDVYIKNSVFDNELNVFLTKCNYLDTSGNITLTNVNTARLEIEISHVTENIFSFYSTITLKGVIKLKNPVTANLKNEFEFNTTSNIMLSADATINKVQMYTESLKMALIKMVNDSKFEPEFVNIEDKLKKEIYSWEKIAIENKESQNSIKVAVSAVVTVISNLGHGSGCIISKNGFILTNHHVINGDTSDIKVKINNNTRNLKAKVIRMNSLVDLALIKVDTVFKNYLNIDLSDTASIGEDVFAIGTPKDISLGQSISKGIVSGRRKFGDNNYFQTDVSINSGNSGGALIDKKNNLIGIINAKLFGFGIEGVGFAIPITVIKESLKIDVIK